MKTVLLFTFLYYYFASANTFYLPGLAPVNYCKKGDGTETCKVCIMFIG